MWDQVVRAVTGPVRPTDRLFIPYVLAAAVIATAALALRPPAPGEPTSLGRRIFPADVFLHPSARIDYVFVLTSRIVCALVVTRLLFLFGWLSDGVSTGLGVIGSGGWLPNAWWVTGLGPIVSLVALDFAIYWGHWMQHHVPVFWELHTVHHSAEVLTPVTVYRLHPVDHILGALTFSIVQGFGS